MKRICVALIALLVGCVTHRGVKPGAGEHALAVPGSSVMTWEDRSSFGVQESGYKKELIYGGLAGNTIKLTYREYSGGERGMLARPAFSQELSYDLSSSKEITFQDIRLQVEKADNAGLSYTVISVPNLEIKG